MQPSTPVPKPRGAPAAGEKELCLPPYFPRVPPECKKVAAAFFDAFTAASDYAVDKVRGASPPQCARNETSLEN